MGENLKVVWTEFSTLSKVVLLYCVVSAWHDMQPLLELKTRCDGGTSFDGKSRDT